MNIGFFFFFGKSIWGMALFKKKCPFLAVLGFVRVGFLVVARGGHLQLWRPRASGHSGVLSQSMGPGPAGFRSWGTWV